MFLCRIVGYFFDESYAGTAMAHIVYYCYRIEVLWSGLSLGKEINHM